MNTKRIHPNFYLETAKYQGLSDLATGWFIKSWKYKINSDEWQICRLKQKVLNREARKHLREALKHLNGK
jgi:hypothetical protein